MRIAVAAWNIMGGVDWSAFDTVCEMFGVRDPEMLIHQLVAIRDAQRQRD